MRKDPLLVLEAAYRFDVDDGSWMRALVSALRPYDLGRGRLGYVAEIAPRPDIIHSLAAEGTDLDVETVARSFRTLPPSVRRRLHAPTPFIYSAEYSERVCAEAGVARDDVERAIGFAVPRMWLGIGGDPAGRRVAISIFAEVRDELRPADRATLDAVTAHLGAALRLRSVLQRCPTGDDAPVEAVLAPDGRLLDARAAAARRSRPLLSDAARRLERARTRKATAEERLELWTALVDGRWSIVESAERDGKRMLLACRNEPRTLPMRRLTARERSVAQYCALGHPLKYVAYELGVSMPAVSATLRSALRKLGLKSRAELIRTFGGRGST